MTNKQTTAPATDHIVIHADGACLGNPGVGGWAFTKTLGEKTVRRSGPVVGETTNNQMEMVAVLQAVRSLKRPDVPATVFTDSEYVVKNWNERLTRWMADGWRGANNKPVANRELWVALKVAIDRHTAGVTLHWLKGHNGHRASDTVDRLARAEAARAAKRLGAAPPPRTRFCPATGLVLI